MGRWVCPRDRAGVITFSLQSGSNGNSIYVEAGDVRLLFDAGISGKAAEGRMRVHRRDLGDVDAVLISHDHVDHIRGAGVFQRKYGLPIYMTQATHRATNCGLGPLSDVRYFKAGQRLWFSGVVVHTIPTPHDAADGVAFIVEHEGKRLGIMTDLGHPFPDLVRLLPGLDACYLESNYDPEMLRTGPYPLQLQERIRGLHGHLSNHEAAELIQAARGRLRWVAIAHLSEHNNKPQLALETHRQYLGKSFPLHVASRHEVSPILEVL
ncbi:MAG TPA: MBL fold metallo-hydrolase [Phycisphaerae bacterium]|nr:MBL fold metallo-hydrolase [Phycisphaerae bacterium]HRY67346.1 MBL fold metallo-hydrolase [Phycisphaerae bacterium]HSA28489.1 MBL fold metallo-hydrolase [Phycisphaerae bacterium]